MLEILVPSWKDGKNCKIFLVLRFFPKHPNYSPTPRFAQILLSFQYFPTHWPMQIDLFFWDRPWYSDESLWRLNFIPYLGDWVSFNFHLKQKQRFSVWSLIENASFICFREGWRNLVNTKNILKMQASIRQLQSIKQKLLTQWFSGFIAIDFFNRP